MTCAACAVSVESMLRSVDGVQEVAVNFANKSATVKYDSAKTDAPTLRKTVQSIGYDLIIEENNREQLVEDAADKRYRALKKRTLWAGLLTLPVVVIGMFFMQLPYGNWIMLVLSTPVVFYFGRGFFVNAIKQLRFGKTSMDTLVALSTGVAWLFSTFNTIFPRFWLARGLHPHVYFEAAAVIVVFILIGKLLEEGASARTSSALKNLMTLQPKTVTVLETDGRSREVDVNELFIGQIILVKPGEKIAVDGTVTNGTSYVDESMVSGEPVPVAKQIGDKIYGGTINQKGVFQFRAEQVGKDTLLAQIITMVQQAQGSKAPVQKLVDKIAGVFVPIVIGIALLSFIAWMILGGENSFTHALLSAVTVLVIACPCALGLATPTAIMVGIGKGAENHLLIRDAESLETAHKVNVVVLDKTGTITEGHPTVEEVIALNTTDQTAAMAALLALEKLSEHPLAEAVVRWLEPKGLPQFTAERIESVTGRGIKGFVNRQRCLVGNAAFLKEEGIPFSADALHQMESLQLRAKTVVGFAYGETLAALVVIADKTKAGSREAIQQLQAAGIEVHLLTGDNASTARALAKELNLAHVQSDLLPVDKANIVKELQRQGNVVAMVGDGINDSQALAEADLSIAMGKGADIAKDVAGITLIRSDLRGVYKALKLSRYTVSTIRQNLFWAFIYNLIGIPIAAGLLYPINGFLLNPMIAGAAMALSSVSVVTNSLRLKFKKL